MTGSEEVNYLIQELLRVANRHKIAVAGFAISVDPILITNFGNCTDCHDIKLYEQLCELCEQQRQRGNARKITVDEVN